MQTESSPRRPYEARRRVAICPHCGRLFYASFTVRQRTEPLYCGDACRFWSKVARGGPDDCWLWQAARFGNGYGAFSYAGRQWKAHRVAWVLTHGPLTKGLVVVHTCAGRYPPGDFTSRRCVNPTHLLEDTHDRNMHMMVVDGRVATGERNAAHRHPERLARGDRHWTRQQPSRVPRGDEQGNATLREPQVRAIRAAHAAGASYSELARQYGVRHPTIAAIVTGATWAHIPMDGSPRSALEDRAWSRTHPERQPRGEQSPNANLPDAVIPGLRKEAAAGVTHRELARRYGVSKTAIGRIVRRETYRHVP